MYTHTCITGGIMHYSDKLVLMVLENKEKIKEHDSMLVRYEQKFDALFEAIDGILQIVRRIESEQASMKLAIQRNSEGIERLEIKVSSLDTKVTKLENKVANVEDKVTKLETKVTNIEDKVTKLETKVTNIEDKVSKLETKVTNIEDTVTKIETHLDI